jgi:hypothetical protein
VKASPISSIARRRRERSRKKKRFTGAWIRRRSGSKRSTMVRAKPMGKKRLLATAVPLKTALKAAMPPAYTPVIRAVVTV